MAPRRLRAFAATALGVTIADQIAKALVRANLPVNDSRPLIDGYLRLTHVFNTGAAFGVLRGRQWLFIVTSLLVLAAIAWTLVRLRPQGRLTCAGLALVTGGAIGNLIDRVVAGGVTDFIDVGNWFPVFNLADIALDAGVALIVMWLLFGAESESGRVLPVDSQHPATGIVSATEVDEGAPPG